MIDDLVRKAQSAPSAETQPASASSRLKSRILSSLIKLEQDEGPLRILSESRDNGESLCVFEHALALLPSDDLQARNPCAVCHARVLGENIENAPIFWPGCAYSRFRGH